MREEPNHHKPPRRKFCNRRRKFATGVAFLWLLSVSPDKAPDRPSDKRKRTKKSGGVRIRTWNLVDSNLESPRGTQALRGRGPGTGHKEGGQLAPPTLVPPAWGVPAWRGWAHCGALWCFPHWPRTPPRMRRPHASNSRDTSFGVKPLFCAIAAMVSGATSIALRAALVQRIHRPWRRRATTKHAASAVADGAGRCFTGEWTYRRTASGLPTRLRFAWSKYVSWPSLLCPLSRSFSV